MHPPRSEEERSLVIEKEDTGSAPALSIPDTLRAVDFAEIRDYLERLHPEGGPVAICCKRDTGEMTGRVFADHAAAAEYAEEQAAEGRYTGIYVSLNRLRPGTTNAPPRKEDVDVYTNLLIDLDRRDDNNTMASDEEREFLDNFADTVAAALRNELGTPPMKIDTGNGCGLIFRLPDLPVEEQSTVQTFLKRLAVKFDPRDENVHIDAAVGDPQRLTRLVGTVNRKFAPAEDRPHRRVRLLSAPEHRYSVERDRLLVPRIEVGEEDRKTYAVPLRNEKIDLVAELQKKLQFRKREVGDETYLDYHDIAGQPCLVANRIHEGNRGNPRCSAFVLTRDRRVYHTCFADGCRSLGAGKTRLAFQRLKLENLLAANDGSDWREHAHNFFELTTELPVHIVEHLVPEKSVTIYSGPSFHGKTFFAQDTAFSIITGQPLLGHFQISEPTPVFYHCPEMSEALFRQRLASFHFGNLSDKEMFLCRTMEDGAAWPLDSPEMRLSSQGRVLILDTLMYFNEAEDVSSYTEVRRFAENCYKLIAHGCRAIIALHHPPKQATAQDEMTLQNYVLGSAGYGGILGSCLGFRCLNDETLHIYLQQLKARGVSLKPFQIEGFKDGHLRMRVPPGESPYLKDLLNNEVDERYARACRMFEEGFSQTKVATALRASKRDVGKWHKLWMDGKEFDDPQAELPGVQVGQ